MKTIRVGVVGVGYLGTFHAEKYATLPGVQLVGVADTDPTRAARLAKRLQTSAFNDPLHLIGRVEAVSVVVPTALHHCVAKPFLEKGIHVLLEKPVTATLEQADELIRLAARNGAILQVGHIERFNPAVAAIRSLVKSPRYITAERAAPFTPRCTDVSVVLDLMIHDLDIVMDLAGSAPREVSAAGASLVTREVDAASARIVFQNGCVADIAASRISEEKKRLLRVFEGDCVYLSDYQTQKASMSRKGPASELITQELAVHRRDTLADEIRAFVQSTMDGTRPLVSGIEGRRALALATTIMDNIMRGDAGFVPAP